MKIDAKKDIFGLTCVYTTTYSSNSNNVYDVLSIRDVRRLVYIDKSFTPLTSLEGRWLFFNPIIIYPALLPLFRAYLMGAHPRLLKQEKKKIWLKLLVQKIIYLPIKTYYKIITLP